jgi:nicotinate-nucleotide adenylyltransferase
MEIKSNKQLILYGGTFDPIHIAHVNSVELLRKNFPEALIVVMTSHNRLKDKSLIPIETRLLSVQKVFESYQNVLVVDWALKWDTSSTYEVTRKIKDLLFPDFEVRVAAGEDVLSTLPKWKFFDQLKKDVNWVFFKRDNGETINKFKEDSDLKDVIKNAVILDDPCISMSSTDIKSGVSNFIDCIPEKALPYLAPFFKE